MRGVLRRGTDLERLMRVMFRRRHDLAEPVHGVRRRGTDLERPMRAVHDPFHALDLSDVLQAPDRCARG